MWGVMEVELFKKDRKLVERKVGLEQCVENIKKTRSGCNVGLDSCGIWFQRGLSGKFRDVELLSDFRFEFSHSSNN